LTTFTSLKEINDSASLTAYIGFFALLWMTWYSNSLFDVRFTADCIFERCAKALHYAVMVGFAVVGPAWEPGKATSSLQKYQVLSFILMVSRLVLAAQYAVTLFFLRKHRRTILPMSLVIGSTLGAALIYGSITAALPKETCNVELGVCKKFTTHVHIAWYAISTLEIIFTVGISCIWRVISFKGTHLVQRMSLLTLIILGEGIIVICKAISKIVKNGSQFDDALTGQIAAAVLIICMYKIVHSAESPTTNIH
jgi:low temperature requirement protein LtrA